jgi:hypothetical protein
LIGNTIARNNQNTAAVLIHQGDFFQDRNNGFVVAAVVGVENPKDGEYL